MRCRLCDLGGLMDKDFKSKGFLGRFSLGKKENNVEKNNKDNDQTGKEKVGFFQRLKSSLRKTHEILVTPVDELILGRKKIDEDTFEGLEEILLTSDVGPQTALSLIQKVQKKGGYGEYDKKESPARIFKRRNSCHPCRGQDNSLYFSVSTFSYPVIGVNGSGKTTTIAKLAHQINSQGKKVLLAAADTFRAAGIEQLEIWGERVGCEMIKQKKGSDPSAVAYDAIDAALARSVDVLIVDTAGRLHTKVNLMEELKRRGLWKENIPVPPMRYYWC